MSVSPLDAVVGTAFSAVYDGLVDLIAKSHMFKGLFKEIKSQLDDLKPILSDITLSNAQLPYADINELKGITQVLEAGEKLVLKCLNVTRWDLYRRYKYATKLLAWGEDLDKQLKTLNAQGVRDGKRTAVGVGQISRTLEEVNQRMKECSITNFHSTWSEALPPLPEILVGLEAPLKKLKTKLLGDDGVSMLVLTAPGGCGKTTLATKFCTDQEVKDVFGESICFVTVSKKYSLSSIVEQLYRQKNSQVPSLQNEVDAVQALQRFLRQEGSKPLLLVLDDVWSGSNSLLQKFDCKMEKVKILVTSRSEFRAFSPPYLLEMLSFDNAMELFHHSASLGDKSSHIPLDISQKIVERCKGFPLAITVVGRSLCAQPIEIWQDRLVQWSKGSSILDYETDLLLSLRSSLDALDNERVIIKQCFLDLGAFPEDKYIPVDALIDMWSELYDDMHDNTSCIAALYELNNRSLATFKRPAKLYGKGYYSHTYTTQHDLLRELAIYHSKLELPENRERLFIDMCGRGSNLPKWCKKQNNHAMKARLVSISTDYGDPLALKWPNMVMPEAEVLVLNLKEIKKYDIPEFVETMENLKVLVVINSTYQWKCELSNSQLLSCFSSLKRIRLEGMSLSFICDNSIRLKSMRKLSLIRCNTNDISSENFSRAFPNLEEISICMNIDKILKSTTFRGLCDVVSLKKLHILFRNLSPAHLPDEIGNLINLEELILVNASRLLKLPDTISRLKKLSIICVCHCWSLKELPECIGELTSLKMIDTRGCRSLKKLPPSVMDLKKLEEVTCDGLTANLWQKLLQGHGDSDVRIIVAPVPDERPRSLRDIIRLFGGSHIIR